ncbi:MAG: hypothetical protein AAGU11_01625 [Syntrophobacteraceae bacterium]
MDITLKQAAKALNITEDEVMELVSSGKIKAEQKGNRLSIDESSLKSSGLPVRLEAAPAPVKTDRPRQISFSDALVHPVLERVAALEKTLAEKLDLFDENRRLAEELRGRDREIAQKDMEIEKLKRDLVYQKRLLEKEIEDRVRVLEEKKAIMDGEFAERVARERDEFERRIALERNTWSDRLAMEQEKFEAAISEAQARGGFWSRLSRMLTWS